MIMERWGPLHNLLRLALLEAFCETAHSSVFNIFRTETANLRGVTMDPDRKSQGLVAQQSSRTEARAQTLIILQALLFQAGVDKRSWLPNSSAWHSRPCLTRQSASFPCSSLYFPSQKVRLICYLFAT